MHRGTDATDKGDREYMEVVATYKFNSKGFIFEHVIDTVVPPEPPMLLWPVVWVAKLLAGGRPGGQRQQLPIPEAINRQ